MQCICINKDNKKGGYTYAVCPSVTTANIVLVGFQSSAVFRITGQWLKKKVVIMITEFETEPGTD
jgi:hypothetical protein